VTYDSTVGSRVREVIRGLLEAYPGITDEELAEKTGIDVETISEHAGIITEEDYVS